MGLISAGLAAATSTLSDIWKEYFYCDSLAKDVLVVKGQKKTGKYSNNNGTDNIITNGSGIVVADGQCMIIVEQGKIVDVCAEPGEYTMEFWSPSNGKLLETKDLTVAKENKVIELALPSFSRSVAVKIIKK